MARIVLAAVLVVAALLAGRANGGAAARWMLPSSASQVPAMLTESGTTSWLPLALRGGERSAPTPVTPLPTDTASATASPTASTTPTPTFPPPGPDLVISRMAISMEDTTCYYRQPLGVRIEIANVGQGGAGPFVVRVNGEERAVPQGLGAAQSRLMWFTGSGRGSSGETEAVVDSTGVVVEAREDNNERRQALPPATPPVWCGSPTPAPDLPDLAVLSMSLSMEDTACWYYQPLGTVLSFENRGAGAAGPFVVSVNDEPRAFPRGLAPGARAWLWFATHRPDESVAVVDATNHVRESDEDNNRLTDLLPEPTPPLPCPSPTLATALGSVR